MQKRSNNKMHSLFLEFILVILIFSVVSMILMGSFIKAVQLSQDSKDKIHAMINISTIAEEIKSDPSYIETQSLWYYDAQWEVVEEMEDATFIIESERVDEQLLGGVNQDIKLLAKRIDKGENQDLWEVELSHYTPDFHIEYEGGDYDER